MHETAALAGPDGPGRACARRLFRIDNLTALRELTLKQKALHTQRKLQQSEVHTLIAHSNVADTLVGFATDVGASQLVLGERSQSWLRELFGGSILRRVLQGTSDVDVHIVRRAER